MKSGWWVVDSQPSEIRMENDNKIKSFRDLLVWQKGIELTKLVYALTQQLPTGEKFGLVLQLRRAAVSVPSDIAEGQVRREAARSSRNFFLLASDLGGVGDATHHCLRVENCPRGPS